jgi:hypothetical protein
MSNYTEKEKRILEQCKNGPFYTVVTEITNAEFDDLVDKLIKDDDAHMLRLLVTIYWDYNRNKMIDYFIKKGDIDLLLGFLDCCYDFSTETNNLDQKYVVDKLIEKGDKKFVKDLIDSKWLFFLTDAKEKERLNDFANK